MTGVLKNISLLATPRLDAHAASTHSNLELIPNALLAWRGTQISWVGKQADFSPEHHPPVAQELDAKGCLVVPGLIDCHTHLAFAGWRKEEFKQRILGKSYLEIAQEGGGIAQTMRLTREASKEHLLKRCLGFLTEMRQLGVTTVECKSGYGLSVTDELKLLEVYEELSTCQPLRIVSTFLGAHTIPAEYRNNRAEFLDLLTKTLIPQISTRKLASFCDVFVEQGAFSSEEARHILEIGKQHGLAPKLHVDQLHDGGGARLAAEVGAVSADHLEHISADGIAALREKDVVAVLLPLATLFTQQPALNARNLINQGVRVAVATDFNPGTAPSYHLPLAMMLSCVLNHLTPDEALAAVTIHAAKALQAEQHIGSLEVGKEADFCVIDATDVSDWLYHYRENRCQMTVKAGQIVYSK